MSWLTAKVRYVDAAYTTADDLATIPLFTVREAYGYVTFIRNDVLVEFISIDTPGTTLRKSIRTLFPRWGGDVVKGLVLPREALIFGTKAETYKQKVHVHPNTSVSVEWRDVVYLANVPFRAAHVMRTRGVVHEVRNDALIISHPQTMRVSPLPQRAHGEGATYMTIPLSLIIRVDSGV